MTTVNRNFVVRQGIDVSTTANVVGAATFSNTVSVTGNTTLSNTIAVTGAATFSNTIAVTGGATLSNTLSVTGAANVLSTLGVTGAANVLSTLGVTGAATFLNTIAVTGTSSLNGSVAIGDSASDSISVNGVVNTNVIPEGGNTVTFGNTTNRWGSAWVGNVNVTTALSVGGAASLNGTVALGDTSADNISVNGVVNTDVIPASGNTVAFGNTTNRWGAGWFGNVAVTTSANLNSVTISGNTSITGTVNTDVIPVTGNTLSLGNTTQRWSSIWANNITITTNVAAEGIVARDISITGNLTVSGTTTYINTTSLAIGDNIFVLNADLDGVTPPTEDAGFTVNRGSAANVSFLWDETNDRWKIGSNAIFDSTLTATGAATFSNNVNITGTANASAVNIGANVNLSTASISVGNSSVNTSINSSSISTGDLTLSGNLTTTGGNFSIGVPASFSNTFSVTGNATFSNTLAVTGATTLSNTLSVTGAANVLSTLGVTGAANVLSTLGVTGAATLANTLAVTGLSTLSNSVNITGTANVSSDINVGANVNLSTTQINVGNATVNTVITSSSITTSNNISIGSAVVANTSGAIINVSSSTDALRITQTGAGNALVVEDDTNPDSTPFVIANDGAVGIGTTAPAATLNVVGSATIQVDTMNNAQLIGTTFRADATGNRVVLRKSRSGTIGTNTIVQSGDVVGQIIYRAADGTNYIDLASVNAEVDGTPGTGSMPGRLTFSTTANGASTVTERMRIDSGGKVGIGGAAGAGEKVTLTGNLPSSSNNSFGYLNLATIPSETTLLAVGYFSRINPAAASFTLSDLRHFQAEQSTFGAGSSVTNQFGYFVESSMTGANNNYAFFAGDIGGAAATTGKTNYGAYLNVANATGGGTAWNLYVNGTAPSFFNSNVAITGTANVSSTLNVGANVNLSTTRFNVGNSSVNTFITSSSIETDGSLTVTTSTSLNGNVALGDAAADIISINGAVNTDIIASTSLARNLGNTTNRWATLWANTITLSNSIYVALGTTSLPAYAFAGDTDTGIYSPAAGAVAITVNGSTEMISNSTYAVYANGDIYATGDVISASDKNVKDNIKTIDNSLQLINSLRGVSYNLKANGERSMGVIAQEVEEVLPELVDDSTGVMSVKYNGLIAVLIEAVKDLSGQVGELKQEIKQLKNEK
jgi:hypothetical protein